MSKTKRKTRSDKFPLTLHSTGQYCKKIKEKIQELLIWLWDGQGSQHRQKLIELIHQALPKLKALLIK